MKPVSILSLLVVIGGVVTTIALKTDLVSSLLQENTPSTASSKEGAALSEPFIAHDAGFRIQFPTVPERREQVQTSSEPSERGTQITYIAEKESTGYYVDTKRFDDPRLNEKKLSSEGIKAALHEGMNAIVEGEEKAHIYRSNDITFQGHVALRYTIGKPGEHLDGLLFMSENYFYNIMVDSDPNNDPSPSFETFIGTFSTTTTQP